MSRSGRLQVICFDLDNTLWDSHSVIVNAERLLGDWLREHSPEVGARYGTDSWRALRRTVLAEQPEIGHDVTRFRLAMLERAFSDAGYPPAEGRRLAAEAFAVFIEARHQVRLYEGVRETLEALRANYQLGTLTNGNADIARLGLTDLFSFWFSAGDVGASKPAPAIFQAAMAHTGTDARSLIHVGDNPRDDVEGARRIGLDCIWVNPDDAEFPDIYLPPTATIRHVRELPALIEKLKH